VANQFAALTRGVIQFPASHGQRDLWELRGFAGAGFSADDNDLVRSQRSHDFFTPG
jgi:hypothetical protein